MITEKDKRKIQFVRNAHIDKYVQICILNRFLDMGESYPLNTSVPYKVLYDGKTIGYYSLDYKEDGGVCFWGFYIIEEYRGRGIGTLVLLRVLNTLKKMGIPNAFCFVEPTNDRANHIYSKYGMYMKADGECEIDLPIQKRGKNECGDWCVLFFRRRWFEQDYEIKEELNEVLSTIRGVSK